MNVKEWFLREKFNIIFVLALILVVGIVYFNTETNTEMNNTASGETIALQGATLKVAFNDLNQPKIFALTSNNSLSKYKTTEGNPIPETNSIVLGSMEANMMKKENLFIKVGDQLNGLFGINPTIEGVLKETGTVLDYFHFVSAEEFKQIDGVDNKAYVKLDGKEASLFVYYPYSGDLNALKLSEGSILNYEEHTIVGTKNYPIILGSTEAKMMREENEFKEIGELVEDFGQKFIVIGVLEDTNSAFDNVHIVPLSINDWNKEGEQ